jgi:hypothetical protein
VAKLIRFFPRKTFIGGASGEGFYSEVVEVTEYSELEVELQVQNTSQPLSTVSGILEETADPTLGGWLTLGTVSKAGEGVASARLSNPLPFVRGKMTIPGGSHVTVSFEAVAREEA